MADHEDYETGEAPAAHKVSHQDGGTDEISVAGLSGEGAALAAHKILPAIHHLRYTDVEAEAAAAALILIHKGDAVAHQDAPGLILTHKGDPVAHQDAPGLILTHKGDASAHHTKFTAANARAAINNIFGSDGKADADIDLDGNDLKGGNVILPDGSYIGIGAALERLEFHTAGHASFLGCNLGIGIAVPTRMFDVNGTVRFRGSSTLDGELFCYSGIDIVGGTSRLRDYNRFDFGSDRDFTIGFNALIDDLVICIGSSLSANFTLIFDKTGNIDIFNHDGSTVGLKLGSNLVTYGPNDSGGVGYKLLRVDN